MYRQTGAEIPKFCYLKAEISIKIQGSDSQKLLVFTSSVFTSME
jgi:hypothetical protein